MKLIKAIFLLLLLILIISAVFQFVINTKYSFPEPDVFYGEKLYNPYRGMDSTKWRRANFHLHTRMLFGLTAGSANSYQLANSFYSFFDFDIYCISDYMQINVSGRNNKTYIPVYEHGYQFYKVHQACDKRTESALD